MKGKSMQALSYSSSPFKSWTVWGHCLDWCVKILCHFSSPVHFFCSQVIYNDEMYIDEGMTFCVLLGSLGAPESKGKGKECGTIFILQAFCSYSTHAKYWLAESVWAGASEIAILRPGQWMLAKGKGEWNIWALAYNHQGGIATTVLSRDCRHV